MQQRSRALANLARAGGYPCVVHGGACRLSSVCVCGACAQVAILGTGKAAYEKMVNAISAKYKGQAKGVVSGMRRAAAAASPLRRSVPPRTKRHTGLAHPRAAKPS
jgi:hypothetical protein